MGTEPHIGPIGQIARRVKDIGAARRWYGEVLGLPHLYSFGDLAFLRLRRRPPVPVAGRRRRAERVDPLLQGRRHPRRACALAARGVAFVNAPHMIHRHGDGTEEWMAFFNDEEGRPLASWRR